jgi:hypothetical protein
MRDAMALAASEIASDRPVIPGLDLSELIGEGGMGRVYKAVHHTLNRVVAVKVLRAETTDGARGPSWLNEPRLMAALAHPHIVTIHDAGQAAGHNYLVLEYLGGGSLRTRMAVGKPWAPSAALAVVESVAEALAHIHDRGVLHLDLKPENILFSDSGDIKVADFGIAMPHDDANSLLDEVALRITLDYCAPEYRTGLTLDERYDVFSLATIVYELLTGRVPGRIYRPASEFNPTLPPAVDDVLRRGLARHPHDRIASINAFRFALRVAIEGRNPIWVRRRIAIAAGIVAVIACSLAIAYYGRRTDDPTLGSPPLEVDPLELTILFERDEDLAYFDGLMDATEVRRHKVTTGQPPPKVTGLAAAPKPMPLLVGNAPDVTLFVHPFADRELARRVVKRWRDYANDPPMEGTNVVNAGTFDGNCLVAGSEGRLWRHNVGADWDNLRRIALDQNTDPCLELNSRDPKRHHGRLRVYQAIAKPPAVGSVLVLRFRARSERGVGVFAAWAAFPLEIPEDERGDLAGKARRSGTPLQPSEIDPVPNRWQYTVECPVTPPKAWRKYVVVTDVPPFHTRTFHRNLYLDLITTDPATCDRIWIDDVELLISGSGGGM